MTKLHDNQKGFVPLRYITEHTRLCAEIAHLSNLTETPSYIVSLDQAKAYDRVDLPLLLDTLSAMGLPADLILMIRDITSKCRTWVCINSGYSRTFTLCRSVRQGDPLSCLLYAFSIKPMGMRLRQSIWGISLLGLPPQKLIMYADDTNLFLSSFEDLGLIRSTMASTSFALGSKFNLEKTDVLPVGPTEHSLASHPDIVACFDGCYVLPPGSPLRVLGAWIGSPDLASARWDQIYSHIKKIICQWNAIGTSACNRTVLAKALLLSCCSYLMDCNGIPHPLLHKINNTICRFVRGRFSNAPFSILSAPLVRGGMNCPSLKERKLAYDAKFMGDLISLPLDLPWKDWTHMDLLLASTNPSRQDGVHLNPLLQLSVTKLSSLEPRVRSAFVSCRDLRYDISCAFPSLAARRDMPSTYHPALPLCLVRYSNSLRKRGVLMVAHLLAPSNKLTRADPLPMAPRDKYLLSIQAKLAAWPSTSLSPSPPTYPNAHRTQRFVPPDSDSDTPPANPRGANNARLRSLHALSLTAWHSYPWWPDSSRLHRRIKAWPAMANAYGCACILNSPQSLLAHPDHYGNWQANPKFFPKYKPAPAVPLLHPLRPPTTTIHVWTDGSAKLNGSPYCSAGSAWASPCGRSDSCHLVGPSLSNNIAKLCAVLLALQAWPDASLHIHTDSRYVLGLAHGGLLAMERDGWLGLPLFSDPQLAAPSPVSHLQLFQSVLHLIRAHPNSLWFSWTRAHAGDAMNITVDTLAKAALAPSTAPLDILSAPLPANWVDSSPVLNNQSLAFLSETIVSRLPPPIFSPKFCAFSTSWSLYIRSTFGIPLDPTTHLPNVWKVLIPVGLRELLWKQAASSLLIGRSWHGQLVLGQTCRCGSEMLLTHVWAPCPAYDLSPLLAVLYSEFRRLCPIAPGTVSTSTRPWLWGPNIWYPLVALRSLDTLPQYSNPLKQLLGTSHRAREWALGSFLWYVWRQCMDEVHNTTYRFYPGLHTDILRPLLRAPHA
jgi:ribonuclease HI